MGSFLDSKDNPIEKALWDYDHSIQFHMWDENFPCAALHWAALDELELFWGPLAPDNEDRRNGLWEYLNEHYRFLTDGWERIIQTDQGDRGAYHRLWHKQYYNWEKPNLYKVEGVITPWYAYELCKEYQKGPVRGHDEFDMSMERLGSIARNARMATLALPEGETTKFLLSLLFESKGLEPWAGHELYSW